MIFFVALPLLFKIRYNSRGARSSGRCWETGSAKAQIGRMTAPAFRSSIASRNREAACRKVRSLAVEDHLPRPKGHSYLSSSQETSICFRQKGKPSMSTLSSRVSPKTQPGVFFQVFSWWFLAACYCLVFGVSLDSWAHTHIPRLETFFTPWHAVLYTGVLTTVCVLPGTILVNRSRGVSWKEAMPPGFGIALCAGRHCSSLFRQVHARSSRTMARPCDGSV